jgi:pimeloyl-ACP methyl ester carboxylesterase
MISKLITKGTIASLGLLLAATVASNTSFAQTSESSGNRETAVKNIVLVHGAWADGSSWSKIIPLLVGRGFNVVAVQNPLTSLQDDVTATQQALARVQASNPGPVLLVGHSYGGVVITQAGVDPNVAGLVYVAAFAPAEHESALGLAGNYPTAPAISQLIEDNYGFVIFNQEGIFEDFAQDVSPQEKEVIFAVQGPTALAAALSANVTSAAWRVKPCWFVVAADDRAISPELERFEARRMTAITIELPTSHVPMISEPNIVAEFIARAAQDAGRMSGKL